MIVLVILLYVQITVFFPCFSFTGNILFPAAGYRDIDILRTVAERYI